jgi:methylated-DNA-[protein]-cysteine S-methyltransferase
MRVEIGTLESPLGTIHFATRADRLVALCFPEHWEQTRADVDRHGGGFEWQAGATGGIRDRLRAYFAGELDSLDDIDVELHGTEFQREVWTALRDIPAGTTTTYGELARGIERPRAVRAVGAANGSNPVSIVVPCHRVIGRNGTLTGYGGGLHRKQWLLQHERATLV